MIAENSPAGTLEPTGSPVDLTISLGAVTVPDLEGDTIAQAARELTAVGLVARIEHTSQCLDPGHVIGQRPSAGTTVAPGSTVTITIDDERQAASYAGSFPNKARDDACARRDTAKSWIRAVTCGVIAAGDESGVSAGG